MIPSLFAGFQVSTENGRCEIGYGSAKVVLCTERSATRDLQQLKQMLSQHDDGKIPVVIAPYRENFAELFAQPNRFIFIAPVVFSGEPVADARLVHDETTLEFFVNSVGKDDKFTILPIPQWQSLTGAVVAVVQQIFTRAAIRLKTIGHFGRLWQINFRLNAHLPVSDIAQLRANKPDALVMAGPSLDNKVAALQKKKHIWCADTAWPALVLRGIQPDVIFSVDAGFASSEHFAGLHSVLENSRTTLVADLIGNAAVQRLLFQRKLTYRSSHPLVEAFCSSSATELTAVSNPAGDVGSLMRAVYTAVFQETMPPENIYGHDGKSRRGISHARGTAYFRRSYAHGHRLNTIESYMLRLSYRY